MTKFVTDSKSYAETIGRLNKPKVSVVAFRFLFNGPIFNGHHRLGCISRKAMKTFENYDFL